MSDDVYKFQKKLLKNIYSPIHYYRKNDFSIKGLKVNIIIQ